MKNPPSSAGVGDDTRYWVPGLERALLILEFLDRRPAGCSVAEMAERLELPTNSVFRITFTLHELGYLRRDPATKRFTLTRKVLTLGYGHVEDSGIIGHALDVMRELRDATQETVVISILTAGEGFVLEQVPGSHPFRFVADPGARQPLHSSASCKAILSFLPSEELEAVLRSMKMPRLTSRTITQKNAYREELAEIRVCGYALDRAEHLEGVLCVAAPVFNAHGYPVASITVTGPTSRHSEEELPELGEAVREHVRRVSARLGFREST